VRKLLLWNVLGGVALGLVADTEAKK